MYIEDLMYAQTVKRLQIYIDEDLDEILAARALREHTSKAALIRQFVAERLGRDVRCRDPLDDLVGEFDEEPGSIDDLVYGR